MAGDCEGGVHGGWAGGEVEEKHHGQEGSVELTEVGEGEKSGRALAEDRGEDLVDVAGCVQLVGGGRHGGVVGQQGLVGGRAEALVSG